MITLPQEAVDAAIAFMRDHNAAAEHVTAIPFEQLTPQRQEYWRVFATGLLASALKAVNPIMLHPAHHIEVTGDSWTVHHPFGCQAGCHLQRRLDAGEGPDMRILLDGFWTVTVYEDDCIEVGDWGHPTFGVGHDHANMPHAHA